jgi:chaperonin cofactor prefoldin
MNFGYDYYGNPYPPPEQHYPPPGYYQPPVQQVYYHGDVPPPVQQMQQGGGGGDGGNVKRMLQELVNDYKNKITTIEDKVKDHDEKLTNVEAKLEDHEGKINELEEQTQHLSTQWDETDNELEEKNSKKLGFIFEETLILSFKFLYPNSPLSEKSLRLKTVDDFQHFVKNMRDTSTLTSSILNIKGYREDVKAFCNKMLLVMRQIHKESGGKAYGDKFYTSIDSKDMKDYFVAFANYHLLNVDKHDVDYFVNAYKQVSLNSWNGIMELDLSSPRALKSNDGKTFVIHLAEIKSSSATESVKKGIQQLISAAMVIAFYINLSLMKDVTVVFNCRLYLGGLLGKVYWFNENLRRMYRDYANSVMNFYSLNTNSGGATFKMTLDMFMLNKYDIIKDRKHFFRLYEEKTINKFVTVAHKSEDFPPLK